MSEHTRNSQNRRRSQSKASMERARRERKKRSYRIMLSCAVAIALGYYILNYVAALEEPPIGATFNIVLGCSIIAVSGLILLYTIKRQYFRKSRKRTRHVFLNDLYEPETREVDENNPKS